MSWMWSLFKFSQLVAVPFSQGVGELTFAFARVLVRARIDRSSQQPNDTEDHATLPGPCSHAPFIRVPTACVSSPRDWVVSNGSHMQQDTGNTPAPPRLSDFLCVTYTPAPPRLSALLCDMFLTVGHKDQDSEKSAIISLEDACRRRACQSVRFAPPGCCEKKRGLFRSPTVLTVHSHPRSLSTLFWEVREHTVKTRGAAHLSFSFSNAPRLVCGLIHSSVLR